MHFHASYDDITLDIPGDKGIYIPAEDSFLLLDLLKDFIRANIAQIQDCALPVLDIGAGCGIATLYLAKFFTCVLTVDINPHAVAFTWKEVCRRGMQRRVNPVTASLLDAFYDHAGSQHRYFLACFNPPYLPPEDYREPVISGDDTRAFYLDKALYAPGGGKDTLEKFLRAMKPIIIPGGHVFFIKSSLSGIDDTAKWVSDLGFIIEKSAKVHMFFEDIEAYHVIA
nr:hypothetical protein [Candidatus Sigynarchaeota archaeon]